MRPCAPGVLLATSLLLPLPPLAAQALAAAGVAPLTATRTSAAVLSPGDAVRIAVWRNEELTGEFVVGADGSIPHPLYRTVTVAGVPFAVAEERLREFLRRFDDQPQFVMEPLLRVTAAGEVARPNVYLLRPETTIAQVVALAGGPTERGRRDRVVVRRAGTTFTTDPALADARALIRSGDEIVVERRRAIFREVVAPAITVAGATAAILNVLLRDRP